MKNLNRTKKLNNFVALIVMVTLLAASIGIVPSEAEGTFTVLKSTPVTPVHSTCYVKDYITVKDGDKVLTENVDYNYGSSDTALNTANAGTFTWSGVIYGMGQYDGVVKNVSVLYRVSQPVATATTTQAPASTTQQPVASTPTDTDSSTTVTSADTKPIEGEVTFKKFMEKYCNYGVYLNKDDSTKYTIGKTSDSKPGYGPMGDYPCSPQYQGTASFTNKKFGTWKYWDAGDDYMSNAALPARLWKKYTADGETNAINCMLDDFEKLPAYEKQLHISNFTYGQILKAAAKVGRTVQVEVLPLKYQTLEERTSRTVNYGYSLVNNSVGCPDGSGIFVRYNKTRVPNYMYANIDSALRCLNKFDVQWKCKGDTSWRTGNCGVIVADTSSNPNGLPMGNGDVYNVRGKQTALWSNVKTIRIRQYRTINGKNYYTDWLTVYKDGKEIKPDGTSTSVTTSNTNAKVKTKTVKKGKKVKVKVSYSKKQKIKWKVKNKKIVKIVKKSGKGYNTITIKGKKAGKTTITGKGKGKTFKIKVTVKK